MLQKYYRQILHFLFLSICSTILLAQEQIVEDYGSILLPRQSITTKSINHEGQLQLSKSPIWNSFTKENGNWTVQWNEITKTPHRAFGKPIQIAGYSQINKSNVQEAANKFIADNNLILGVDVNHLKLVNAKEVNNRWYITYKQFENDIEVLHSEVILRIFGNGKIMAFGSDYYRNINVPPTPSISYETAKQNAVNGLNYHSAKDEISGEGKLYYLPIVESGRVSYNLVYKVYVKTHYPAGNYVTYVDANNGDVKWRYNKIQNHSNENSGAPKDGTGTVKGIIHERRADRPTAENPFQYQILTVGGVEVTTAADGSFTFAAQDSVDITSQLKSPWANVTREDGENRASYSKRVGPNENVEILWDSTNSHDAERDVFYHVNFAHDYLKNLDENFTGLDYSLSCEVNDSFTVCNAQWDGERLTFFPESEGECKNYGTSATIIYHEYAHAVNDKLYEQAGVGDGMINITTHEGMADVFGQMILKVSGIGADVMGEDYRDLKNTLKYPVDAVGNLPHYDGQIIGGAFWDLAEATSFDLSQRLAHYAKWGTPDDLDIGVAFSEWYLEVLLADDNDGDISNGTPNMEAINNAFDAHCIGGTLFLRFIYTHETIFNQPAAATSYQLEFSLGNSMDNRPPEETTIHYSLDNFATTFTLAAEAIGNNKYTGSIPQVPQGSRVKYYFSAIDPFSNTTLIEPIYALQGNPYFFYVGLEQKHLDAFERESGWSVGAPDDDATTGMWEIVIPEIIWSNLAKKAWQPGEDHSENGEYCFVTKAIPGDNIPIFLKEHLNGQTTLFSPSFNISDVDVPVISYYKWFTMMDGSYKVDITNDNGVTWHNMVTKELISTIKPWERESFLISDYFEPSGTVQLRFIAKPGIIGFANNRIYYKRVIILIDDFEIFGTNGEVTAVEEIDTESGLPKKFEIHINYPNPFNPGTNILFEVPFTTQVSLKIYNYLGQEIRTLVSGTTAAGVKSVRWDGKNNSGISVPSGIYIYRFTTPNGNFSQKMILIK